MIMRSVHPAATHNVLAHSFNTSKRRFHTSLTYFEFGSQNHPKEGFVLL